MNRLFLTTLSGLGCFLNLSIAQTDTSTGTGSGPNETPYPQPPSYPTCRYGDCPPPEGSGSDSTDTLGCNAAGTEAENDSCGLKLNFGLTTYTTSPDFLKQDQSLRIAPSKGYNPPCVGIPPFKRSLASEWGKQNKRPVCMLLRTPDPSTGTIRPNSLETYGHSKTDAAGPGAWTGPFSERATPGNCYIKRDNTTDRFQVLSDQFLVDAKSENSATVIRYYPKASAGQRDANTGFHPVAPNAQTLKTVRITQPTPNVVSVVQDENFSSFTSPKTRGYRWAVDGNTSVLTRHNGNPSSCYPYERDTLVKTDLGNGTIQRVRKVERALPTGFPVGFHPTPPPPGYQPENPEQTPPGGYAIVSRTMEQYRDLGNGNLRIFKKVEGYETSKQVTTEYTYTSSDGKWSVSSGGQSGPRYAGAVAPPPGYTGPLPGTGQAASATNDYLGSRVATLRRSDGYWEDYAYDFNPGTGTMLTRIWSCWKNSSPGDHTTAKETIITLEAKTRTVIEKVAGQIISSEFEKLTVSADGTRTLREEKRTGANTSPLITETAYFPDSAPSPNNGRIKYVRHSDGTFTRYAYSTVPDFTAPGQTALKTVTERGAADIQQISPGATGDIPSLVIGTRDETITNSFEKVIDSKLYDIASGLLLKQSTTVAVDAVGRPTQIIHDADPNDYEQFTYSCCGLKTYRARDGSLTVYSKDALDRPTETVVTTGTKTATTSYAYAAEVVGGQTLSKTTITRNLSAGSSSTGVLFVSETLKDSEGRTIVSRVPDADGDGLPEETTSTFQILPEGGTERIDTQPDGSTAVTRLYADGKLRFQGGTSRPDSSYDYGVHHQFGGGRMNTANSLDAAGAVVSVKKTYMDQAGQVFLIDTPAADGGQLELKYLFDDAGRRIGTLQTGRPAMRWVRDSLGNTVERWVDSNGDGTFNNVSVGGIKDNVVLFRKDVVAVDGDAHRRERRWLRDDDGNDVLVSTHLSAVDGLHDRTIPLDSGITDEVKTKPLNGSSTKISKTFQPGSNSPILTTTTQVLISNDGGTVTTTTIRDADLARVSEAVSATNIQGFRVQDSDGRGFSTIFSDHTAAGLPKTVTQGGQRVTHYGYDHAGRVVMTDEPDTPAGDNVSFTSYHPTGDIKGTWGAQTYPTYRIYDEQRRLVELRTFRELDPAVEPTVTTGATPASTASVGISRTTWVHQAATGLLIEKRDDAGEGASYSYSPDGRLLRRTWARGVTTDYGYAPSGMMTTVNYSDSTPDLLLSYDRLFRPVSVAQQNQSQISYDYTPDTLRLASEEITYDLNGDGIADMSRELERGRDTMGRTTSWAVRNGGSLEYSAGYGYDPKTGRMKSAAGLHVPTRPGQDHSFAYTYLLDTLDIVSHVEGPVHEVTNSYDTTRDELLGKTNAAGSTIVSSYQYQVDFYGSKTTAVRSSDLPIVGQATLNYAYDSAGQVVSADSSVDANDRSYQYDSIGNRRKSANSLMLPEGDNYSANALNQYMTVAASNINPSYDLDGNMTSGPLFPTATAPMEASFSWNAENEMTTITRGDGQIITYKYDAFGRRIARIQNGITTAFVYSGWNLVAEYTVSGGSTAISKSYLWGKDVAGSLSGTGGTGGLLAVTLHGTGGTSTYYPLYDGGANITQYLDSAGQVVANFGYDPFGNAVVSDGPQASQFEFRFSTRYFDAASGLYYYGYRYYEPVTGRWLSRDPIKERGGINLYAFAFNASTRFIDILGLANMDGFDLATCLCKFGAGVIDGFVGDIIDQIKGAMEAAQDPIQALKDMVGGLGDMLDMVKSGDIEGLAGNLFPDLQRLIDSLSNDDNDYKDLCYNMGKAIKDISSIVGAVAGGAGIAKMLKNVADLKALKKAGLPGKIGKDGKISAPGCFAAGTAVLTMAGWLAIEDVKAGDTVMSFDPAKKEWVATVVIEPLTHTYTGDVIEITAGGATVTATGNHPFLVVSGTDLAGRAIHPGSLDGGTSARTRTLPDGWHWVAARNLKQGDTVLARAGGFVVIESLKISRSHGITVYNLDVDGADTFSVTPAGILVHNDCGSTKEIKTRPTKGSDGGASEHIIERDASGEVISKTHRVTNDGKVVHQHQDHQGKHGGEHRFPDEWVEYPEVNAPPHIERPPIDNSITE